jgi:putative ABC transport system substrate-binding protein
MEAGMLRSFVMATGFVALLANSAVAADFKIVIATWRGCEEACQGFQDYLSEHGVDAEFVLRDAARKEEALPGILADARAEDVDLILTWGTSVTRGIAGTLGDLEDPAFNHDIPGVFTIVADPVGAGIVESLDDTGRPNITGTYNRVPEAVNIETMRTYVGDFERLGMLYNTNEENSVLKRDEVAALTEPMGFELIALELSFGDDGKPHVADIASKMAELKAAEVDFLYLGSSSFLRDNAEAVGRAAIDNGIPLLSPYEEMVRESEALLSVAARYYQVGRLAGEQAEKILVDGVTPGDLPVLRMTTFAVVINMNVAGELELFPPLDLLQIAETVN